jgi:hypothetical protein
MFDKFSSFLQEKFVKHKDIQILDVSIDISILALNLVPEGHEDQAILLSNLAGRLALRFEYAGESLDLNEAIGLLDKAISIEAPDLRSRVSIVDNLATLNKIKTYRQRQTTILSTGAQPPLNNGHEASFDQDSQYSELLSPDNALFPMSGILSPLSIHSVNDIPRPNSIAAALSGTTGPVNTNNARDINTGVTIVSY